MTNAAPSTKPNNTAKMMERFMASLPGRAGERVADGGVLPSEVGGVAAEVTVKTAASIAIASAVAPARAGRAPLAGRLLDRQERLECGRVAAGAPRCDVLERAEVREGLLRRIFQHAERLQAGKELLAVDPQDAVHL